MTLETSETGAGFDYIESVNFGDNIESEFGSVISQNSEPLFSLMVQLTDGEAKKMLMTHKNTRISSEFYSLLEMNGRWDPQTKSGKLAALVDLVTTSPVELAENFIGKLLEWEAREVEAHMCFGVLLPEDIKTAILISMAPLEMGRELVENLLFWTKI